MGKMCLDPYFRSPIHTFLIWSFFTLISATPKDTHISFVLTSSLGALLQCLLEKSMFQEWKQFIDDKTKNYVYDKKIIENIE
jgi:hypothetical protein